MAKHPFIDKLNKADRYFQYFFLAYLLFLFLPAPFFRYPEPGIDNSWNIALNLAYKYHLVFGKDFIFTYGPLGILHSRLPIAVDPWIYLLFDLYFLVNLFFILRDIFRRHFTIGVAAFIFVAGSIWIREELYDWFFFFLLFYLFSYVREPSKPFYLVRAAVLAVIGLYFKLNLGIIAIIVFFVTITYSLLRKKLSVMRFFLFILFILFLIWTGGYVLNVDLKRYIIASLQLIKGYADASYWPVAGEYFTYFHLTLAILAIVTIWIVARLGAMAYKRNLVRNADELFIYALICLAIYLYFKSSFVRADGHVFQFFRSIPVLVGFLFLFSSWEFRVMPAVCCWLVLALSVFSVNLATPETHPYRKLFTLSFIGDKAVDAGHYFSGIAGYRKAAAALEKQTAAPNALKTIIGSHTADALPWEISTVYFNGLRYDPRPVIQSYSAYTTYLDSLNFAKYNSPDAPDYLLWSYGTIDLRYAFYDETRTKLAILDRYRPIGDVDGVLVLRKNGDRRRLVKTGEQESEVNLNQDIPIGHTDGLQFARLFVRYRRKGRLLGFLQGPPTLKITITLEDGHSFDYSGSPSILADGVIINKYVDSKDEFELLMRSDARLTPDVRKIRIDMDTTVKGFVPEVKMASTFYRFNERTAEEKAADSIGIAELFGRLKPVPLDLGKLRAGTFKYVLTEFHPTSMLIKVKGWAFDDSGKDTIRIVPVLRSRDAVFELPTERQMGMEFSSTVAKSGLPPGDYQLGLSARRKGQDRIGVLYTGLDVLKRRDYTIQKLSSHESDAVADPNMKFYIDHLDIRDGEIHIGGWGYRRGADAGHTVNSVILKGNKGSFRIAADATERSDVAAAVKDTSLDYCGFDLVIAENRLPNGQYSVGLEQTDRNGRRTGLRYTGQVLNVGWRKFVLPVEATDIPVARGIPVAAGMLSGVDHFNDGRDSLFISGWAIGNMKEVPDDIIGIVLKNDSRTYLCPANAEIRKDLTEHYHNGLNLDDCGFSAKIVKSGLPNGTYQIGLWVHRDGDKGAVKFLDLYTVKN